MMDPSMSLTTMIPGIFILDEIPAFPTKASIKILQGGIKFIIC
jgi:hypothetical protein